MFIPFKNFTPKKNVILFTLLSCSALGVPSQGYAEALSAKTSWAVSRVVSSKQGSYCTMAQRYSDDTVLTLAKNISGENSLAIDFKKDKFNSSDKQKIVLYPQGASSKTFTVNPKSDRTLVVNLGADSSIIDEIAATGKLTVDVNGKKIDFTMTEFKSGQDEMNGCMGGLKTAPQITKKLESNDLVKRDVIVVKTPEISQPTAESLLAAVPMSSSDVNPIISPEKEKEFIAPEPTAVSVTSDKNEKSNQLVILKEENARLSRAMSEQRQVFENAQASKNNSALTEVQAKLDMAVTENDKLKQELSMTNSKDDSAKLKFEIATLTQSVNSLQSENQTLKNQIQIATSSKDIQNSPDGNELSRIQIENKDLKKELAQLKETTKSDANPNTSQTVDDEVIKLRTELRQLIGQSDVLKTENSALKSQIASLQSDIEGKQITASGGNWDLEQSTRRYQESQREIVRLGALLQAQNTKCASEKKDIEYMLFDPAIADKAQISMLNSLEDQIKEKNEKLKLTETQLESAKLKVSSEKDVEISNLKKSIIQTKLELSEKLKQATKSQEEVMLSLKTELDVKNKQLADAQAKIDEGKIKDMSLASKQQSLDSLKAELAQKNQQLIEAQAKVEQGKAQEASLASKQQSLDGLKAELAQKNLQLTEAQAKNHDIEKLKGESTSKDQIISSLKADLSQKNQALADVQAKVQLAEAKVEDKTAEASKNAELVSLVSNLQTQIQQANLKIADLQAEISNSKNNTIQASASHDTLPAIAPSVPSNINPVSPNKVTNAVKFKSMNEMSSLLKKAGIVVKGPLSQIQGNEMSDYKAYGWKTDSLHGSVEMTAMSDVSRFNDAVDQYLSRAETRCKGEFAAIPASTETSSGNSKAYEIACVGSESSSSASVIFSYGDKVLTTIAHEGRAEEMDLAIDARDKVASQLY
jgi:hypothetical protein